MMNSPDISNKSILLIMPEFHNHEKYMVSLLEKWGANVATIQENVRTTKLLYKISWHISRNLGYWLLDQYYKRKLRGIHKADIILVIKGESISEKTMRSICHRYPKSKKILYEWDSTSINPQSLTIAPYFDAVASFDPEDAAQYGWKYRPLFFEDQKETIPRKELYDLSFIGTIHTHRINIFRQAKLQTEQNSLIFYAYLYSNFFTYNIKKFIKKDAAFQGLKSNEVHYKPLPLEETISVYRSSKVILDYAAPGQNGLTMRTIEALCNGCKLLTNNKNVRNISLFQESNIAFYDEADFQIPEHFCETPALPLKSELIEYYTLEYWLEELIGYLNLRKDQ